MNFVFAHIEIIKRDNFERFSFNTCITKTGMTEVVKETMRELIREFFKKRTGCFAVGVIFDFECPYCLSPEGEHENDCFIKKECPTIH